MNYMVEPLAQKRRASAQIHRERQRLHDLRRSLQTLAPLKARAIELMSTFNTRNRLSDSHEVLTGHDEWVLVAKCANPGHCTVYFALDETNHPRYGVMNEQGIVRLWYDLDRTTGTRLNEAVLQDLIMQLTS